MLLDQQFVAYTIQWENPFHVCSKQQQQKRTYTFSSRTGRIEENTQIIRNKKNKFKKIIIIIDRNKVMFSTKILLIICNNWNCTRTSSFAGRSFKIFLSKSMFHIPFIAIFCIFLSLPF